MAIYKLIHLLSALIWVGGMFFAYVVLRPAAVFTLEPPHRLRLWVEVFRRFFAWVWAAIALLLITGLYMVYQYGNIYHVGMHVHIMLVLGVAMIVIYSYVYFSCYIPLSLRVEREQWLEAGAILGKIRKLVALNLTLGLITVSAAVIGMNPVW